MIALLPEFLDRPNVLGLGGIGLHKCTPNEVATLQALVNLGLQRGEQMLFHTPHLEDKYKGTRMILDLLRADRRVDRSRICIDHCEEHTIRLALDEGYWAGITLYPLTKATPERAVDLVEIYGPEQLLINSSADWDPSDPLAVLGVHLRDAAPRPRGIAGAPAGVRQSAEVFQPEPQLPVHAGGIALLRSYFQPRDAQRTVPTRRLHRDRNPLLVRGCRWSRPPSASPLSPRGGGRRCRRNRGGTAAHAGCPKSPLPDDRRPPGRW